jgi:hypothetical protein
LNQQQEREHSLVSCESGAESTISLEAEFPVERFWTAVLALVLALMLVVWGYGIYCYVQMVRHRRPDIRATSLLWPADYLTERGREFRRRALRSYGAFALLALLLILLNLLLPRTL